MLIPEAWDAEPHHARGEEAFYEYHASLMEPWDGPAAIAFTDGRVHWRDARSQRSASGALSGHQDDLVILASETGVLPVKPEKVKSTRAACSPATCCWWTLEGPHRSRRRNQGAPAERQPYGEWLKENQITLDSLPEPPRVYGSDLDTIMHAAAGLRLYRRRSARADARRWRKGRRAHRLHGHRYAAGLPFRQAAAAVPLLQTALRAGDQSGHRSHSRRDW